MKTESFPFVFFLRWFAIALFTGIVLVIVFVALVDPYGLYGFVERDGFNAVKPGLTRHHNEIKLAQAARVRPNALILGNSRAEIGFDPDSAFLPKSSAKFYNLAVPGSSIGTARWQLAYLHQAGIHPKTIVLGVEFLDFLAPAGVAPVPKSHVESPPQETHHSSLLEPWQLDTLFSITSVVDAVRTLRIQSSDEAATMTRKGFNPLKEYRAFVRHDGYYAMFQQRALENAKAYSRKAPSVSRSGFQQLRAILDMSAKTESDVRLVIYPYHAQILILFEETGMWESFEKWKDMLVTEVKEIRQRYPHREIRIIDFSGYGPYNCERIPGKDEHPGTTRWYWEGGHFKKELGDLVLQSIFASHHEQRADRNAALKTGSPFGTELNVTGSSYNKRRIAIERDECARAYPALFFDTKKLVRQLRDSDR